MSAFIRNSLLIGSGVLLLATMAPYANATLTTTSASIAQTPAVTHAKTKAAKKIKPRVKPKKVNCKKKKCVALTFDDGPGPYTNKLLRILKKKKVPATFFLVGQRVGGYPKVVRRIVRDGHQLGNHSWNHASLTSLSNTGVKSQISKTDAAIKKIVGFKPKVLRPLYGNHNSRVDKLVRKPLVLWNIDTLDWKHRSPQQTINISMRNVSSGSIVLMHDIHKTTVNAVPKLIKKLKKKGYTLVTLDQMFARSPMKKGKTYYRY